MKNLLITVVRVTAFLYFLYWTVNINAQSAVALVALFASVFLLGPSPEALRIRTSVIDLVKQNPFKKGRTSAVDSALLAATNQQIVDAVTYDAESAKSLEAFHPAKMESPCLFAKQARIWGSDDWSADMMLEDNIRRLIPTFLKFTCLCVPLRLDGFLFQLPGLQYGQTVQALADGVRRTLMTLSKADPGRSNCMLTERITRRDWVFQFNHVSFFITTFAPCYPASNARYLHGCTDAFIFFQPEVSFAQRDLPFYDGQTNWKQPRNIRDQIRVSFRDAGRPYRTDNRSCPSMAYEVVRSLNDDEVVEWWTGSNLTKKTE